MLSNIVILTTLGIVSVNYSRAPEVPSGNEVAVTFENGILNCNGYENTLIRTDKIYAEKVNKSLIGLAGEFEVTEDISGPLKCILTIQQQINGNWEYCCEFEEEDFCESLTDRGKPWYFYVAQMKINGCPISKGTYTLGSAFVNTRGKFPVPRENKFYQIEVKLFQNEAEVGCYIFNVKTEIIDV